MDSLVALLLAQGGRPYLVGGCVRDGLWGQAIKDLDIEVFGLDWASLTQLVAGLLDVDLVGKSFGILKVKGYPIDISIPRRERKSGVGHRGFEVDSDPNMSLEEAALRRDFTINALYFDLENQTVLNPVGGLADLNARQLRHVSHRFCEDPLRVLRGMQLLARFRLTCHPDTLALCRQIDWTHLTAERIFEEFRKLILQGLEPSRGLQFLVDTGWIALFPEFQRLIGCPQNEELHPEGDVWNHTLSVMDAFASARMGDPWEDLVVGWACLCHDLGKPQATKEVSGTWRAPNHGQKGVEPTQTLLARLTRQTELIEQVTPLVANHLVPFYYFKEQAPDSAIRRLAMEVKRIDRLVRVAQADHAGRPPIGQQPFAAGTWLLERARALGVENQPPQSLIMGRHLIERGIKPGPHFKTVLAHCLEAQLEGAFADTASGLVYLDQWLAQATHHPADLSDRGS
ncbi:MAG: HD domain-containing protein [Acidobacteria bacterium]|nr:HD domain-containing protein [Acidobacteriota bacterium]MCB9397560.1 HD domain-containing protein [Acidobacteriota bacterium]